MSNTKQTSDVIVIGGGVIGLAIAQNLAGRGASVALLERGQCGQESSWAGAGIVQSGNWHRQDPLVQIQRESVRMYGDFVAELQERTGIDPEYSCCGCLELLLEDQQYRMARSEVKAAAGMEKEYGRPVLELLEPDEVRRREPAVGVELLGAKYDSTTGQVRSPRLVKALIKACADSGVEVAEDCEVKGLQSRGGRVTGVQTVRGVRSADSVILAAGCWSAFIDEYLSSVMPTIPVRGQVVLLSLAAPAFSHVLERGRCYLVPRKDGMVVLGATQEPEAGFDKSNTAQGIGTLLSMGVRLVPALGDAGLERIWAGLRPGTPDGRPYIGPVPGMANLIAATGHFRSGLTMAPATAQIVADLVTRGRTSFDLSRCMPGRKAENSAELAGKASPASA